MKNQVKALNINVSLKKSKGLFFLHFQNFLGVKNPLFFGGGGACIPQLDSSVPIPILPKNFLGMPLKKYNLAKYIC